MSRAEQSDADGILPVTIGTGLWAVALVTLLLLRPQFEQVDELWIAVAVVGLVSGMLGLLFLRWRKRRHTQA
jgi:peptidoglycan biosynthesis protein MviN/MurJ (putative lipid II flippase)